MVPPPGLAAAQGKCVDYTGEPTYVHPRRILVSLPLPRHSLFAYRSPGYREVHPCRPEFEEAHTTLYKSLPGMTLHACAILEHAVAFWPGCTLGTTTTCGLVWPKMRLTQDEASKTGTCFMGPYSPR